MAGAPLREADFRLTCENGFGDGWNGYAHSMAWFRERLYVGTTRGTIAALKTNHPRPDWKPWPVECPEDLYEVDRRAQIWEYTPETGVWRKVYQAPWVPSRSGRQVPRYIGLRGMTVFQGPGDAAPCLYVSTWAPLLAQEPPDILRSEDGENFVPVPRPPWDTAVRSFRTLQIFQGRVHTSPTGSATQLNRASECIGSEATIYAADDLRSGAWQPASGEGFGDARNVTVFEMGTFNGHLYAGTVNMERGFELWKTPGGALPYRWTRVLEQGAYRGPLNELALSLCEFKGALYLGTGIVNGGYHRSYKIGPGAAELLRIWPDDSWDLIVGEARHTPQGLKVPLSGFSPGFDNLFNGYLWRMGVHDGWLYVGSFSWANLLPFLPRRRWPRDVSALVERWGEDNLVRRCGGLELWRSADGVHWEAVTLSGFGNRYNWGVRNFASTPHGLFVGTANVFGPNIAVQDEGGWRYAPNPRGGCEIWLGQAPA